MSAPPVLTAPDTTQQLAWMLTGQRTAPPAMGTSPLEGTVVTATATTVVVTIVGFDSNATFTCKYTTLYKWSGSANVAVIPPAGTDCLVVFPQNAGTPAPWVIGFVGL